MYRCMYISICTYKFTNMRRWFHSCNIHCIPADFFRKTYSPTAIFVAMLGDANSSSDRAYSMAQAIP